MEISRPIDYLYLFEFSCEVIGILLSGIHYALYIYLEILKFNHRDRKSVV